MQPLDGLYYFTQVVVHGGFARAARALGIPKSRVSRHVMALEAQLNVRLINRSTRRFAVTEVGQEVYRHATAMLAEADAALEAVEFARAEPRGTIRASCPVALAQSALAAILPDFLAQFLRRGARPSTTGASSTRGRGSSSERMARTCVRSTPRACYVTISSCCAPRRSRVWASRSCPRA